jgi:hypothetical protein
MRNDLLSPRRLAGTSLAVALAAALLGAGAAHAGDESCREWLREHCDWKARAIHHYLTGAPQRELDEAVFEILQREAYLTSCEMSAQESRAPMVGWRLVGRAPDEYAAAVLESVLERAGLDLDLRASLGDAVAPAARPAPEAQTALDVPNASLRKTSYARRRIAGAAR